MKTWEYAVKSINDVERKGLMTIYYILVDGFDMFTGKTRNQYVKDGFQILSEEEFDKAVKTYEDTLIGKWVEISEAFYNDQMNVLPPMFYYNGGFFISEADCGNIHGFYQKYNNKYYTSLQRINSKRSNIIDSLENAIMKGRVKQIGV